MSDQRKFQMLAGAGVLLVLLVLIYEPLIETRLSAAVETARRKTHYEQVIQKKGLTLHEGAFSKTKE